MNTRIYTSLIELRGFSAKNCPAMPTPSGYLMCPPDHYDVLEVRNPHMAAGVGRVDRAAARAQWDGIRAAFEGLGKPVKLIEPVAGLEDMTFAANQSMTGLTARMEKVCLLGQMRHPGRRGEVPHYERWFAEQGYKIARLSDPAFTFEGTGDCVWHPGKRLLWGGYGFRTDPEVYEEVAAAFEAPVVLLKLVNERFYHLDTCFCPLNQEAVLIYPPAFSPESLELILKIFPIVLAAEEREASQLFPCNAVIVDSRTAILQKGANQAVHHLKAIGLDVLELETGEFLKSGGSVFCLKMGLY
ncbi:MAG TPA: arginine deiminase-related protein [Elusimicrobiota bacterium]|jgi:N-dimethylarginine dimethylaminohydrolase|nr:arginine deiminase-related protein [Elusimicrobiota bacterium]